MRVELTGNLDKKLMLAMKKEIFLLEKEKNPAKY
jgi:hypothetical protein